MNEILFNAKAQNGDTRRKEKRLFVSDECLFQFFLLIRNEGIAYSFKLCVFAFK